MDLIDGDPLAQILMISSSKIIVSQIEGLISFGVRPTTGLPSPKFFEAGIWLVGSAEVTFGEFLRKASRFLTIGNTSRSGRLCFTGGEAAR